MKTAGTLTLRDVARAAGVAPSTVSKALRSDPSIPEARCLEIQALARRMGYAPNPMVAALMSQLHHRRRRSDPHHIAWIDLWPEGDPTTHMVIMEPLLEGARRRAAELGYSIEVHAVRQSGLSPERLRQVLTARSQWGLILPPVPASERDYPLDLRGLTGVTIGTSLRTPVMHRVSPNHFQGGEEACRQLRKKGYRRIGLALSALIDSRTGHRWLGAFLGEQQSWPTADRLPPLLLEKPDAAAIQAWFRRHRPDAVLLAEETMAESLGKPGARRERPPALAWLMLEGHRQGAWGIDFQAEQVGMAALDMVVGQIHRNERGSPATPHTVLIDGVWRER